MAMLKITSALTLSLLVVLTGCASRTTISPGESRIEQNERQHGPTEGKFKIRILPPAPPAHAPGPSAFSEPEPVATLAVFASKPAEPERPAGMPEAIRDTAKAAMDKGVPIEIEGEWKVGGSSQRDGKAEGQSPGFVGDGDAAKTFKAETPQFTLFGKGGGSTAAGGTADVSFQLAGAGGLNMFTVLGGLGLLIGIAGMIFAPGMRRIFMGVAGLGAASIGVGLSIQHAPWLWILLVAGGLAFGAWWVWNERKDGRTKRALQVVAEGLEKAPEEAASIVKGVIGRGMKETKQFDALDRAVNEAKAEAVRRAK